MLSVRAWIMLALGAGVVFVAGMIYAAGHDAATKAEQIDDLSDAIAAGQANKGGLEASLQQTTELARETTRLHGEVANGRRDFETAPAPQAGFAGASTRVDPGLGQRVLCRVQRVRGIAESEPACRSAPLDSE